MVELEKRGSEEKINKMVLRVLNEGRVEQQHIRRS
jgi:hypothetical protein